jgi:hypothetical protein
VGVIDQQGVLAPSRHLIPPLDIFRGPCTPILWFVFPIHYYSLFLSFHFNALCVKEDLYTNIRFLIFCQGIPH